MSKWMFDENSCGTGLGVRSSTFLCAKQQPINKVLCDGSTLTHFLKALLLDGA